MDMKLQIMKKAIVILTAICFTFGITSCSAQKYKTQDDTVRLNKEYAEITSDIQKITEKLASAQNELPKYQEKGRDAQAEADDKARESSKQASKAENGQLNDAKKDEKKADKALDKAEDAKSANNKIKDQNKKIEKLMSQLQKKQEQLQKLDKMRSDIMNLPQ